MAFMAEMTNATQEQLHALSEGETWALGVRIAWIRACGHQRQGSRILAAAFAAFKMAGARENEDDSQARTGGKVS